MRAIYGRLRIYCLLTLLVKPTPICTLQVLTNRPTKGQNHARTHQRGKTTHANRLRRMQTEAGRDMYDNRPVCCFHSLVSRLPHVSAIIFLPPYPHSCRGPLVQWSLVPNFVAIRTASRCPRVHGSLDLLEKLIVPVVHFKCSGADSFIV